MALSPVVPGSEGQIGCSADNSGQEPVDPSSNGWDNRPNFELGAEFVGRVACQGSIGSSEVAAGRRNPEAPFPFLVTARSATLGPFGASSAVTLVAGIVVALCRAVVVLCMELGAVLLPWASCCKLLVSQGLKDIPFHIEARRSGERMVVPG